MDVSEADDSYRIVAHPKPPVSERRRLQNRMAQRKFRERKAQNKKLETEFTVDVWAGSPCDAEADYSYVLGSPECAEDALAYMGATPWPSSGVVGLEGQVAYPMQSPGEFLDTPYTGYCMPAAPFTPDLASTVSSPPSLSSSSGYPTPTTPLAVGGALTPVLDSDSTHNPLSPYSLTTPALAVPNPAAAYDPSLTTTTPTISSTTTNPNTSSVPPLLHVATRARNRSIASSLLKHGASPDERDPSTGRTALHEAAALGDAALAALLLRYGASAHAVDGRGHTPLYVAVAEGGAGGGGRGRGRR